MRTVQKLTALKRRSWRDMHNFELANPANEFRSVSTIKELEHREFRSTGRCVHTIISHRDLEKQNAKQTSLKLSVLLRKQHGTT